MRIFTLLATVLVFSTGVVETTSAASCPALAVLSPCTRAFGQCGGGYYGGMDCECMVAPPYEYKTCQGRVVAFNIVSILPEFPSQTSPCDHKVVTVACYMYHLCRTTGGTTTGLCAQHINCVPLDDMNCKIGGAVYTEDDCPPQFCSPT